MTIVASNRFSPLLLSTLLALSTGCGMIKNMDDMKNSTTQMNRVTGQMSQTTSQMSDTTGKMQKEVNFTYFDMRIGNTRQARQEALSAMVSEKDIGAKMGYASEYFAAMEYQFWKPSLESDAEREVLLGLAVKDFFRKVREYMTDLDSASPLKKDEASQNLYALAATLHYVNTAQSEALREKPGAPELSMLNLIEAGLQMKGALEKGTVEANGLPTYQLEVLRQEQAAVHLLQVRQNFLKAFGFMLSATLPNGSEPSDFKLLTQILKSKWLNRKWTPNFASRNSAQVEYNAIVLEYAAETRNFLKSLSYQTLDDSKIHLLLSHADVNSTLKPNDAQAKRAAIQRFAQAILALK